MNEKEHSSEWKEFIHHFFKRSDYEQWHDGPYDDIVLALNEDERKEAEDLLIESVKKNDQWPTVALALLKSKKAIPVLKEKLKKCSLNFLLNYLASFFWRKKNKILSGL